ncbi:class I poly(R)-hydroxyalkanoic acid synthase [Aurantimonas sp. MSK8Z-1]|uniref:class I poly(R)-hydroxyalkanoic acid synthase n=1 Tax=Mangrovibrevibacter kandeliae TaxID=2968473 RepID=UPI0021173870|nr:class I poly(R)-hydroxyalkanoic acid synthase [Aurantimonas sp. MSK8Z-1]MCW4114458.1 class I poly(R)-hydroxyalkanoic acid synthase [Aurantimonas sp. MSK8Z-1]
MNDTGEPGADGAFGPYDAYTVRDPEALSRNLARALEQLGKAASEWLEPRENGTLVDQGPISFPEVAATIGKIGEYWLADPARIMEAQTRFVGGCFAIWANTLRRMAGETPQPPVAPAEADKRFRDADWSRHLFFDVMKQFYLFSSGWAEDMVARAEGLDPHTRDKAAFYVKQITQAVSPSNFVLTNPELFRETMATNGENLVRGMRMFAEDMAAGRGQLRLRQADYSGFEVGRNLAATPGKVVAENRLCQIIQYAPTGETVLRRPLLIVPPWINKYYILDLTPEKSLIAWMVEQGHTVFVISWVNPTEAHAALDWRDYIEDGILFGLDTIEAATGEREVNAVGYCVGGTLLSAALASLAGKGDDRIRSATLLTTQVDFTDPGDLKLFVDETQLELIEASMAKGYLEGAHMATAFNLLRAGDLIWPYFVNNYLMGKEPLPFDLLYWNADATRMSRANHLFYLRNFYLKNKLVEGTLEIGGERLDLSRVTIPIYELATREDHIAPARSVFLGSRAFGTEATYVLTGSGHIAGVVNPPSRGKYQYWSGPAPSRHETLDDWLAHATETKGSWWPHWQAWIEPQSGERVPARQPGGGRLSPIEDAPGTYVKVRS